MKQLFPLKNKHFFKHNAKPNLDNKVDPHLGVARQTIENFGKKLATFTQKNHDFQSLQQSQNYQSIDVSTMQQTLADNAKLNKNAFHEHIPKLTKKLFGISQYSQFNIITQIGKMLPNNTLENTSDKVFLQIGKLAQTWAHNDLKHDPRFNHAPQSFALSERHALAQAIAHQNRAWVAVGSLTNVAGMVGILADTVWLLTIALRSIFQIASIYGTPLTGRAGIVIAYEILAKANLSKLQEKQTLLAGIGVIETVIDKNQTPTLPKHNKRTHSTEIPNNQVIFRPFKDFKDQEYKKFTKFSAPKDNEPDPELTQTLQNVQGYISKIVNMTSQLKVAPLMAHKLPLATLNKVLPIAAVAIGASYNNGLMDEILTLAIATFAPQPKMVATQRLEKVANLDVDFLEE